MVQLEIDFHNTFSKARTLIFIHVENGSTVFVVKAQVKSFNKTEVMIFFLKTSLFQITWILVRISLLFC